MTAKRTKFGPGHPIYELLDVGIPLGWKLGRDLADELTRDPIVPATIAPDNGSRTLVDTKRDRVEVSVQAVKLVWEDAKESEIIAAIKDTILHFL
jgi:hypothetical protein